MKYPLILYRQAGEILDKRRQNAWNELLWKTNKLQLEHPELIHLSEKIEHLNAERSLALFRHEERRAGKLLNQIQSAQDELSWLMKECGLPADYLKPRFVCSFCMDTGTLNNKMCQCKQEILNRLVYEQLCDVSLASECSFENFELSFYAPECRAKMRRLQKSCQNYAETFSQDSVNLLFTGGTGLGKTHLSLAIAGNVVKKGHLVLYASAPRMMGQFENAKFRDNSQAAEYKALAYGCELLVIDDLGAEMSTKYTQAELYDLINSRMNYQLPTVISTNLNLRQMEDAYSARVFSRILGKYVVNQFEGKDIRVQKLLGRNEAT